MQAKTLLIPLAAFALTATTASAFNSEVLQRAGLTEVQIEAFETAHELRKEGDNDRARTVLAKAGIDIKTMESVREAMHEYKDAMRTAIDDAVRNNDYDAFKQAIEGSPLADIITRKEDFALFKEAHDLREAGEIAQAREIMEELGMEHGPLVHHFMHHPHHMHGFSKPQ